MLDPIPVDRRHERDLVQRLHAPRPSLRPGQIGKFLLGHSAPAVDEDNPIGHGLQLGEDMTRHEYGAPVCGQSTQDSAQFDPATGIQTGCWLVEQQYDRVVDERAGKAESLLLAARENVHRPVGPLGEMDEVEQLAGSQNPGCPRKLVRGRSELENLAGGQRVVCPERVRHPSGQRPDGPWVGDWIVVRDPHRSGVRTKQCGKDQQERRFSRAVGADQRGYEATWRRQVDIVDGHDLAEGPPYSDGLYAGAVPIHRYAAFAGEPEDLQRNAPTSLHTTAPQTHIPRFGTAREPVIPSPRLATHAGTDHAGGRSTGVGLIVQKYGGSSVSDAAAIKRVAQRIVATSKEGHEVVVVVSAMGDTTDELLDLAGQVSPLPAGRELDMLLTAGERISMALLAMAIGDLGHQARSFTGSQAGVITTSAHGSARIIDVTPGRIRDALNSGAVAIVAGFQGVSQDSKDVTTLGRGGSDTTAVALAAALDADVCEIYTDVDGIFTADPRIVSTARRIPRITYEEMLEMAASGAKILHLRCVEYARRYGLPIHVRSSFSTLDGTWVVDQPEGSDEADMEQPIISGVAHDRSEAKITIVGVPDKVGVAAAIFQAVADAEINLDMIVQNVSAAATNRTDISFTLPKTDGRRAMEALSGIEAEVGFESLRYDDGIGKVSLIGAGMRSHPGVSAQFFGALAAAGVNIEMISTSEIRISVVVRDDDVDLAVAAVHRAFDLEAAEVEAVVYGGSGR
jgi:aspartate kinase